MTATKELLSSSRPKGSRRVTIGGTVHHSPRRPHSPKFWLNPPKSIYSPSVKRRRATIGVANAKATVDTPPRTRVSLGGSARRVGQALNNLLVHPFKTAFSSIVGTTPNTPNKVEQAAAVHPTHGNIQSPTPTYTPTSRIHIEATSSPIATPPVFANQIRLPIDLGLPAEPKALDFNTEEFFDHDDSRMAMFLASRSATDLQPLSSPGAKGEHQQVDDEESEDSLMRALEEEEEEEPTETASTTGSTIQRCESTHMAPACSEESRTVQDDNTNSAQSNYNDRGVKPLNEELSSSSVEEQKYQHKPNYKLHGEESCEPEVDEVTMQEDTDTITLQEEIKVRHSPKAPRHQEVYDLGDKDEDDALVALEMHEKEDSSNSRSSGRKLSDKEWTDILKWAVGEKAQLSSNIPVETATTKEQQKQPTERSEQQDETETITQLLQEINSTNGDCSNGSKQTDDHATPQKEVIHNGDSVTSAVPAEELATRIADFDAQQLMTRKMILEEDSSSRLQLFIGGSDSSNNSNTEKPALETELLNEDSTVPFANTNIIEFEDGTQTPPSQMSRGLHTPPPVVRTIIEDDDYSTASEYVRRSSSGPMTETLNSILRTPEKVVVPSAQGFPETELDLTNVQSPSDSWRKRKQSREFSASPPDDSPTMPPFRPKLPIVSSQESSAGCPSPIHRPTTVAGMPGPVTAIMQFAAGLWNNDTEQPHMLSCTSANSASLDGPVIPYVDDSADDEPQLTDDKQNQAQATSEEQPADTQMLPTSQQSCSSDDTEMDTDNAEESYFADHEGRRISLNGRKSNVARLLRRNSLGSHLGSPVSCNPTETAIVNAPEVHRISHACPRGPQIHEISYIRVKQEVPEFGTQLELSLEFFEKHDAGDDTSGENATIPRYSQMLTQVTVHGSPSDVVKREEDDATQQVQPEQVQVVTEDEPKADQTPEASSSLVEYPVYAENSLVLFPENSQTQDTQNTDTVVNTQEELKASDTNELSHPPKELPETSQKTLLFDNVAHEETEDAHCENQICNEDSSIAPSNSLLQKILQGKKRKTRDSLELVRERASKLQRTEVIQHVHQQVEGDQAEDSQPAVEAAKREDTPQSLSPLEDWVDNTIESCKPKLKRLTKVGDKQSGQQSMRRSSWASLFESDNEGEEEEEEEEEEEDQQEQDGIEDEDWNCESESSADSLLQEQNIREGQQTSHDNDVKTIEVEEKVKESQQSQNGLSQQTVLMSMTQGSEILIDDHTTQLATTTGAMHLGTTAITNHADPPLITVPVVGGRTSQQQASLRRETTELIDETEEHHQLKRREDLAQRTNKSLLFASPLSVKHGTNRPLASPGLMSPAKYSLSPAVRNRLTTSSEIEQDFDNTPLSQSSRRTNRSTCSPNNKQAILAVIEANQLESYTAKELSHMCSSLGIPKTGTKQNLIYRLGLFASQRHKNRRKSRCMSAAFKQSIATLKALCEFHQLDTHFCKKKDDYVKLLETVINSTSVSQQQQQQGGRQCGGQQTPTAQRPTGGSTSFSENTNSPTVVRAIQFDADKENIVGDGPLGCILSSPGGKPYSSPVAKPHKRSSTTAGTALFSPSRSPPPPATTHTSHASNTLTTKGAANPVLVMSTTGEKVGKKRKLLSTKEKKGFLL